ncbi:hypothetical protein TNCV_3254971 [Trichonephila clavipes]|nr:hypothetical protein TNCV_3254971 [Trichonephila clavipes]
MMSHKKAIEVLNRNLQDLGDSTDIMGGMVVLLAGDFRQTLPCSMEDMILLSDVSPKHPTHVRWDLKQRSMLTNPFDSYPHFLEALHQQRSCVHALKNKVWHLGTDVRREGNSIAITISDKGETIENIKLLRPFNIMSPRISTPKQP